MPPAFWGSADACRDRVKWTRNDQQPACLRALPQLPRIPTVRGVQDEERRRVEGRDHPRERLLRLQPALLLHARTEAAHELGGDGPLHARQLREVVLAVEEGAQVVIDRVRVELEGLLVRGVLAGVPAVERPVAGVDGELGLLEDLERGRCRAPPRRWRRR